MDASASTPKAQRSSFMSHRGMALLMAVIVVVAIVLVVVATHHSSPKQNQNVAVFDENGHVVSVSSPTPLTYVYTYNANVVAVKCRHANRQVELRATTPSKLQSLINRSCQ